MQISNKTKISVTLALGLILSCLIFNEYIMWRKVKYLNKRTENETFYKCQ